MKPYLELIQPSIHESFMVRQYLGKDQNGERYPWHYHEEIEIDYVRGGTGTRYVGNHLSMYNDGDLIVVGSNVPHCGLVDKDTNNEMQTIIYFKKDLLYKFISEVPEAQSIRSLLNLMNKGLAVEGKDKLIIGKKIEALKSSEGFKRIVGLLEIFHDLSQSKSVYVLNEEQQGLNPHNLLNEQRISIIFNYVQMNFTEKINITEIAGVVDMTESAFCRYFKKYTHQTFTSYLNHYRIMHACQLMRNTDDKITDIAFLSGFSNFSYFNRVFKQIVQSTPSTFRKSATILHM
jgi:AraC-like DNA-binding protein